MKNRAFAFILLLLACGDDGEPIEGTTGDAGATTSGSSTAPTTSSSSTTDMPGTTDESASSSSESGEPGTSGESSSTGAPLVCNEVMRGGPSFVKTVWPILADRCDDPLSGGCHQNGGRTLGLVLDMDVAYDNLVCAMAMEAELFRVNPGDPETSYWFRKLSGTHVEAGGNGMQMPFGGPYLEPAELDTLEAWIAGGASP